MSTRSGPDRASKLVSLFNAVLYGKRLIQNTQDAALFLEAATSHASDKTPSSVVERLIDSKAGLDGLQAAVRKSFKLDFITSFTLPFLKLLSDPQIRSLGDGILLAKILDIILLPRSLWVELLKLHQDGQLQGEALIAIAWLCFEIVSSASTALGEHQDEVQAIMEGPSLLEASSHEARAFAYRIQKIIHTKFTTVTDAAQGDYGPGGRHDNDFANFREIKIYPTNDELLSMEKPFLQRLDDIFESSATPREDRPAAYLDWMFRLLREDMLHELRDDLHVAMGKIKGRRQPLSFGLLSMTKGGNFGPRINARTLTIRCGRGMEYVEKMKMEKRKKYLSFPNAVFKHGSLAMLCLGTSIIAFGSMLKDNMALIEGKTIFGLQITEAISMKKALTAILGPDRDKLVLYVINTPTFAYEPILKRLKTLKELPLDNHLLGRHAQSELDQPERMRDRIQTMVEACENHSKITLRSPLGKALCIGGAQLRSLINGLKNPLAQIQGPPGTGKSFIGALIVLQILQLTERRIVVLSFTNHALDQFLADLEDIGVDESSIVRLGSKCSAETESFKLENRMKDSRFRLSPATWTAINALKANLSRTQGALHDLHHNLARHQVPPEGILNLLEFSENDSGHWHAFQVPASERDAGFRTVLSGNHKAAPEDLYDRWRRGLDCPLAMSDEHIATWKLSLESRQILDERWSQEVRKEDIAQYAVLSEEAGELQNQIDQLYDEAKRNLVRSMRVVGCTTTGAAMYQSIISTAAPDVVIVEEAGEILEAHVVAALSPSVKQLILIGDHKQLRPKVNSYSLTVEKGDGYDLNVSMFERLVRQGHPYTALQEQHRSHPDISHYARLLAYENLEDSTKTLSLKPVKGLRSRVVFMHHEHPEDDMQTIADRRDQGATRSKRNVFEARMVLKTVRYLAQQGYNTRSLVVLTPYLGQLTLLKELLSAEIDPVLNDLDSHELLRAGLLTNASTQVNKQKLRLSTIGSSSLAVFDMVLALTHDY